MAYVKKVECAVCDYCAHTFSPSEMQMPTAGGLLAGLQFWFGKRKASSAAGLLLALNALASPAYGQAGEFQIGNFVLFEAARPGRCGPDDINDQPLRAYRRSDGKVIVISTHYRARFMIGPTLLDVERECAVRFQGKSSSDPARFSDRSWLAAVWTGDGLRIDGLVHNEFQGHRHPGACRLSVYAACWYNAVVAVRSIDGGRSFVGDHPPDLVAAPPFKQDQNQGVPRGFFEPSNIIFDGKKWYSLIYNTGNLIFKSGVCLFISDNITASRSWRPFYDGVIRNNVRNPYIDSFYDLLFGNNCTRLGPFSAAVGSIIRRKSGDYLATSVSRRANGRAYLQFATTRNFINWSSAVTVMEMGPASGDGKCADQYRYLYPSILDPSSESRTFDTANSRAAMLFLVRIKLQGCRDTLERDVVYASVDIGG